MTSGRFGSIERTTGTDFHLTASTHDDGEQVQSLICDWVAELDTRVEAETAALTHRVRCPTETTKPMELPQFRYHPDPVQIGVIEERTERCVSCGEVRKHMYTGAIYARTRVDEVCPWCVADGTAAAKFDATFVDGNGLAHLPQSLEPVAVEARTIDDAPGPYLEHRASVRSTTPSRYPRSSGRGPGSRSDPQHPRRPQARRELA